MVGLMTIGHDWVGMGWVLMAVSFAGCGVSVSSFLL